MRCGPPRLSYKYNLYHLQQPLLLCKGHLPQGHLPMAPSYPQQQFVQQQMRDVAQYVTNTIGVNVDHMGWTPPWAYQADSSPDPQYPGRPLFIPPFAAHPTYSQTAGPPAAPRMDPPLFPDYYSQQGGIPLEASEAPNRYVREMTDEFWHSQRTRAMDGDTMPHFAYMPSPLDPDRPVAGVHMDVPEAMGDMPANSTTPIRPSWRGAGTWRASAA